MHHDFSFYFCCEQLNADDVDERGSFLDCAKEL